VEPQPVIQLALNSDIIKESEQVSLSVASISPADDYTYA
jgi:hypothetical protein